MFAAPGAGEVEGPPRGHQHASSPAGFLDGLGAFTREPEGLIAGHDLGVRTALRIPLKDLFDPVLGVSDETVQ